MVLYCECQNRYMHPLGLYHMLGLCQNLWSFRIDTVTSNWSFSTSGPPNSKTQIALTNFCPVTIVIQIPILGWTIKICKPSPRFHRVKKKKKLLNTIYYPPHIFLGFPGDSDSKESACNIGDLYLIPGSGRSPGGGNGYPLQYFCLKNSMDRGAWRATVHAVAKNQRPLGDKCFPFFTSQVLTLFPFLSSRY